MYLFAEPYKPRYHLATTVTVVTVTVFRRYPRMHGAAAIRTVDVIIL
jgi:hypothetical protein